MRRKVLVGMLFVCTAILFLSAFVSSAVASTLYVLDDYSTIQAAVDSANTGDVVIVRDGTYTENVDVNKRLTIRSVSRNPADTIVQAANPDDHIFEITANDVNISGFTVKGATDASGISLDEVSHCNISNNVVLDSEYGICLSHSNSNKVMSNNAQNNREGIHLFVSNDNNIMRNNASSNREYGVCLWADSSNNEIAMNNLLNEYNGIYLGRSSNNNRICLNNFIDNYENAHSLRSTNTWSSTSKITYKYKGNTYTNYLGNYWDDYTGPDADKEGIGDTPYSIDSDKDNYPMMNYFENYFTEITPTTPTPTPTKELSLTQLTTDPSYDANPVWSPDGLKIAFSTNRAPRENIWIMNANGSDKKALTIGSDLCSKASWSSDGSKITFWAYRPYGQGGSIWTMNADGSSQTKIYVESGYDSQIPTFSPDRTKIVFNSAIRYGGGPHELYKMNSDGTDVVKILDAFDGKHDGMGKSGGSISYSPDRKWLAFESERSGNWDIWIVNPDGGNLIQLTANSNQDFYPAWSPDGKQIAFASDRSGNNDIWILTNVQEVINGKTPNYIRLTTDSSDDKQPSWSSDGTKIAFSSDRKGNYDIWVASLTSVLTPTPTAPTPTPTEGLKISVRPDKDQYIKGEEIGVTVTATENGEPKGNLEKNKFEIYRFRGLGIAAQYFPTEFDASKSSEGIYKIKFAGDLEEGENQICVYYDSSPYDADKRPKVYDCCSIEVILAPAELPESKGPLQVEFDCPSRVSPGSEFNIKVKIKNPSKSAFGWYAIFKKEDVKNIQILSPYIQLVDQPKIYPDYVGSDFYEKWKQATLPKDVIVEGGKALLLKKIDPLFVFGILTGTPMDPPGIVALLAEWPIHNEIKRSTKNFVIFTCDEEGIREGIPIPPYTNLIIEIPAKAPPTKGEYEIGLSIPYEHTSRKVGGFGAGGTAASWRSVELSSGVAVGTETVNVPGFEAVFAIAGLLAVAYILRRRK